MFPVFELSITGKSVRSHFIIITITTTINLVTLCSCKTSVCVSKLITKQHPSANGFPSAWCTTRCIIIIHHKRATQLTLRLCVMILSLTVKDEESRPCEKASFSLISGSTCYLIFLPHNLALYVCKVASIKTI